MTVRILIGDCREKLREIPADSVQCCVTSPPYFGLRSYDGGDAEIGREPTPADYVAELVAVFREVRRVLRPDGVAWVNLGDTRKDKQLLGIPWRTAFALQADGWWLRDDCIWAKPNPMPESMTDRCTKSHEYVFLLTKAASYYFDAKAIAEPAINAGETCATGANNLLRTEAHFATRPKHAISVGETRNKRSVWSIATQPYSGAHFATMPPELAETCIKAGTSERGQCPHCGAPWGRQVEVESRPNAPSCNGKYDGDGKHRTVSGGVSNDARSRIDRGWAQSCSCPAHQPVPQMVLDPFGGAGTTALVADRLQRNATIIELNPSYASLGLGRLADDAGLFAQVAAE